MSLPYTYKCNSSLLPKELLVEGNFPFLVLPHLKANIEADPEHLQKKIRQYFLENQHRLTLVMVPKVRTKKMDFCFPYSVIPLRAWMQATRAVFYDPARVALAVGSGSASMPVVLEAVSGLASCPLLLDSPVPCS